MREILALAAALILAAPAFADEPSSPSIPYQGPNGTTVSGVGPQSVTIPFTDLQSFADKVMDLPYKQAAPLLQELQRIVGKNAAPPKPPEAPEKSKK